MDKLLYYSAVLPIVLKAGQIVRVPVRLGELLKPFRPLDDEITDLDNVKGSGWKVLVIDKVINMPSGFPEEKYCIFEQIYATVSSIKQTITFNDSKRIVTRNSTGAKFGEWREISLK